ncbi:MAG: hypothetical protein DWQ20_00720 [Actinobacteria bacterium]|nr:MAG: hypothetical protein DWQ20_00720 [Actinomycetota bacterium]
MPWVERGNSTDSGTKDPRGSAISRRFLVWDVQRAHIIANPGAILKSTSDPEPLPAIGSSHPTVGGLRLDRYVVADDAGSPTRHDVQALYSTDGRFVRRSDPSLPLDFAALEGTTERVEVKVPYVRREYKGVLDEPGGTRTYVGLDREAFWTFPLVRSRRIVRVLVDASDVTPASLLDIDEQVDRLHFLTFTGGSGADGFYRFIGPKFRYKSLTEVEISYEWQYDRGIRLFDASGEPWFFWPRIEDIPVGPDDRPVAAFPYIGFGGPSADYFLPPYYRIVMFLPPLMDGTGSPIWRYQRLYSRDDDGWRNFPGLNI